MSAASHLRSMKNIRFSEIYTGVVKRGSTGPMRVKIKLKGKDAGDRWVKTE